MSNQFGRSEMTEMTQTSHYAISHMAYLDLLSSVERLHRLLLDVIKDDFERTGMMEINPVQALLLYNVGEKELSAGELKSRGYYQGSNVSYNLRKLVDLGYMSHERCEIDRRSVRVKLTEEGHAVRRALSELFERHAMTIVDKAICQEHDFDQMSHLLKRIERFWTSQIRYIY